MILPLLIVVAALPYREPRGVRKISPSLSHDANQRDWLTRAPKARGLMGDIPGTQRFRWRYFRNTTSVAIAYIKLIAHERRWTEAMFEHSRGAPRRTVGGWCRSAHRP